MNPLLRRVLKLIFEVNILKSVYFNFHYLPFKQALRFPVLIYRRTKLAKMNGKIIFECPITPGLIKFGVHCIGLQDKRYSRSIWNVSGNIIFKGGATIGRGTKLEILENATLKLGNNFSISSDTEILCRKEITFGDNCLLSWQVLLMDTDSHQISDFERNIINQDKPIHIGNHVWIGCRNVILKGVTIGDDNIIASNSTISKSFLDEKCIIGGHGKSAQIIKRDVNWRI